MVGAHDPNPDTDPDPEPARLIALSVLLGEGLGTPSTFGHHHGHTMLFTPPMGGMFNEAGSAGSAGMAGGGAVGVEVGVQAP